MDKIGLVIGVIFTVGAMLVIPGFTNHMAKASQCSASVSSKSGPIGPFSGTFPGSCSFGFSVN